MRIALQAIIIIATTFPLTPTSLKAQKCENKKLAPKEWLGQYDYVSQTTYTQLAVGDIIRVKAVVYSQYDYRIFVVGEKRLGKVEYKIIEPQKKFEPVINQIIEKEVLTYQLDSNGLPIYDQDENPIPTGTKTIYDTLWSRQLKTSEITIYDNTQTTTPYCELTIKKNKLLIVEIVVPPAKRHHFGCIALMIGRRPMEVPPLQ